MRGAKKKRDGSWYHAWYKRDISGNSPLLSHI